MSALEKVIGVFLSPKKTFEAIDQRPDWVVPLIIILFIILVFTIVTAPVTIPEQMEKQKERMEERGMSDEQIETAMATGEKFGKIIGPIGAVIGTVVMLLIFTLILWFVGNILLGGQTSFVKMFSVYNYSSLIGMVGMLLSIPIILSKKTANVHFSLASFLSEDQSKTLPYQILKQFSVFSIWQFAVLAIGFAVIYKFSMKKSAWTMVVLFLIAAALAVTFERIFAS